MKKVVCFIIAVVIFHLPLSVSAVGTSARSAILLNGETGEVIFESNADEVLPMASTTKIMTALLLCENGDFEREITVTAEMLRVEGSSMGLLAGDKVTLHDLLYGLMLASGNDAANVVAYTLGGTVDGFVKQMNEKAKSLGLKNTSFATPSGLDAEGHHTTARELALLAKHAMQNEDFAKAASSRSAVLNYGNPPYRRSLTNHNKLLNSFEGAVGVKTGFTKKSGRCLVSAAKRDGKYVIAVTLNDPDDWLDHKNMLEYGFSAINTTEIAPDMKEIELPVIGGAKKTLTVEMQSLIVNSVDTSGFEYAVNLPKFLYAPIKKGEKIGSIVFTKNKEEIKRIDLCAKEDVSASLQKRKATDIIGENFKYIFKNIWEK